MKNVILSVVIALAAAVFAGDPPDAKEPEPEKFIGVHRFENLFAAVTTKTEAVLDGKQVKYMDIPDETTKLIEVTIDFRRNVITKIVYKTVKDF